MNRPPDRDEPDWAAAEILFALAPVGNPITAQLHNHLERAPVSGTFYEREISGSYLQLTFFGAREGWRNTVLCATGNHRPQYISGSGRLYLLIGSTKTPV